MIIMEKMKKCKIILVWTIVEVIALLYVFIIVKQHFGVSIVICYFFGGQMKELSDIIKEYKTLNKNKDINGR